jgi:hypothetical protein
MVQGVPLNKEIMALQKFLNSTALASPYEKYDYDVLSKLVLLIYVGK